MAPLGETATWGRSSLSFTEPVIYAPDNVLNIGLFSSAAIDNTRASNVTINARAYGAGGVPLVYRNEHAGSHGHDDARRIELVGPPASGSTPD